MMRNAILMLTAVLMSLATGCQPTTKETDMQAKAAPAARVTFQTTMGVIVVELDYARAPATSANFARYVSEGFYNGVIFHRIIPGYVVQGGGFTAQMVQKSTHEPIPNEAANGLKNLRGTISMARGTNPASATCQFFINLKDNTNLDYVESKNAGYAVFGKVVEGMDVVDAMAAVKTQTVGMHQNVPVEPIIIQSASIVQ